MKKLLALLLALAIVLSLAACGGAPAEDKPAADAPAADAPAADAPAADAPATIKIGLVFPITGGNADQGVFNVDGAKYIVDYINKNGGVKSLNGAQLELVVYDNMSDTEQCKATAERLIQENPDVVAVTGAASSSYVLPMLPVFEKAEVPFLTAQVSESITNQGYNYAFRVGSTGGSFAEYQVKFVEWLNAEYNLGITKIGIVYEDTEWGLSNTSGAVKAIEATEGLEIVYQEAFTANGSDLSNIVVGLMNSGAEVVFPTCYTQDAKLLFNTMKAMEYAPLIIGGGGGFLYPAFAEELGDLVDGVVSVTGHNYDLARFATCGNDLFANFGSGFEAMFGYFAPEQAVATASAIYDAYMAMEATGSTEGAVLADYLHNTYEADSLSPGGEPKDFDETGAHVTGHAVIVQWQKGEDGVYRTRTVFPAKDASADFQLTDGLKAMMGE